MANVNADTIKGNPWPTCSQLPCICLGDSRLQKQKEVLRFECNTTTNFDKLQDVTGKYYIIPKVENCGTYKPDSPTARARCLCPDINNRKLSSSTFNRLINA